MKIVQKKLFLAVLLPVFLFSGGYGFYHAGSFLIAADKPLRANAIVVLMGAVDERIPEAVDLYREGFAPFLVFPDDYEENPPLVLPDGEVLPNDAAKARHLSLQYGLPDSVIVVLQGPALNTQAEAEIISRYLENHPEMDTVLLVSSSFHMRRAGFIFRNQFASQDMNITLIRVPSRYSTFEPDRWWKTSASRNIVYSEYLKMVYNLLWDRWW